MEETLSVYEVRCEDCQTSFPVGTRECIHCGQRIRGPRRAPAHRRLGRPEVDPQTMIRESSAPATGAEVDPEAWSEEGRGEEEPQEGGGPFRISLWTLSVGLALLGSMFRTCQGG